MKNYYSLGLTPATHQSYRAGLKQYAAFYLQTIHSKSCYLRQAADHERHLQGEMQDHFTKHSSHYYAIMEWIKLLATKVQKITSS